MRELEDRLSANFKKRTRHRAQLVEQMRRYRGPILDLLAKDPQTAKAVPALRRLQMNAYRHKLPPPHKHKITPGIFTGSIGATIVPPYDYQWTWSATAGNPSSNSEKANKNSGDMSLNLCTDFSDNSSAVSGNAAVGIYFRPPAPGFLQIWSSPSFNDQWGDFCSFDSAHADGWIGLYVGSYDMTGASTGAVVDQKETLWSDDSWWAGVGQQEGSNSAYGLYAGVQPVWHHRQYQIWVWCGGDVSGQGWGQLSGSAASDQLNVYVPSITWEFTKY